MSKIQVNIKSEGKAGRIEIIGSISEWNENNATDMRTRCNELKTSGVTSCHVYLMTGGGDCFQANEIVNILTEIFGSYTAEGGALVASAGTYIAVHATSFSMAKNGQMMIHKPQGFIEGTETDVESQLKLLKNITAQYYQTYTSKLKKPEADFKAKWDAGDFWLTAQEAIEWGFANEIKEPEKISDATETLIKAILENKTDATQNIQSNNKSEIEMKNLVTLLVAAFALEGINEQSTEAQVVAALQGKFNLLKDENNTLQAAAKAQTDNAIKAMLDEAQAQGKIFAAGGKKVEDVRATYEKVGQTSGIDALATILGGIQAPGSIVGKLSKEGKGGETSEIKIFADLVAKGEDYIKTFKAEHEDEYKRLYKAEFGHN